MENNIMICAHPDDEMLFGGQILLNHKNWKVICVTNRDIYGNILKNIESFEKIMAEIKIDYEIWDYIDYGFDHQYENIFEFQNYRNKNNIDDQLNLLLQNNYDKIVTHNPNGEYGHPQHIALSLKVFNVCKKNNLLNKLYNFDLTLKGRIKRQKMNMSHKYIHNNKTYMYNEIIFNKNEPNNIDYDISIINKKIKYCYYYNDMWLLMGKFLEFIKYSNITKCNYTEWKCGYNFKN